MLIAGQIDEYGGRSYYWGDQFGDSTESQQCNIIRIHIQHDVSSPCFNTTDQLFQNSRGWKEITPPVHKTYIVKLDPECDIRENFDTNECPNIFVSTKLHE